MKLIEHLEHVIGLVDRSASNSEVKSALLAMHEEVAGHDRAVAEQVALNKQHSDEMSALKAENAKLVAAIARSQSPELEAVTRDLLMFFFDEGDSASGHSIQQRFRLKAAVADYHIDELLRRKFITQTRLGGDSASCWYAIAGEGRDFIMKNRA